ncbi:MAG: cellulase family glycosylhydrolase, partial [Ktedonobacteraceae bacterium]
MNKQAWGGDDLWRNLADTWLTRRAFLRTSGLATGLASTWLAGCSPGASPKKATAPTPTHDVRASTPGLVIPAGLGVNIHPSPTMRADIGQLAAVGFRVVRLDFSWSLVERQPGVYDFSLYEPIIETLAAYGIRPLGILAYNNTLYEPTSAPPGYNVGPHTDEVRRAFARFAAAAAGHFKGRGIYWEVWNEPDYMPFWFPTPLADDYMALAKLAIPAMRQADHQATIIAPALTGLEPQYQAAWTFLERCLVLGLADLADALSLHPYRID